MKAIEKDHIEIVKILVERERIDINAKDDFYFIYLAFPNELPSVNTSVSVTKLPQLF